MAKIGLTFTQAANILRPRAVGEGWALCVGAGVSLSAFPTWDELVSRLIARDPSGTPDELADLTMEYAPDSLIEAAKDRLRLDDTLFAEALTTELYAEARAILPPDEWSLFVKVLNTRHLGGATVPVWREFLRIVETRFPTLTATTVAEVIADSVGTPYAPCAILSFNAEPLLAALINAKFADKRGKSHVHDILDYIVCQTSDCKVGRIPFTFCHGLLAVPTTRGRRPLSSVDKLVYSEGSYLQLANSIFSWQSASFMRAASSHSTVFVGLSLTDPNMRRWLTWVHSMRVAELCEAGVPAPTSTAHYWLARRPPTQHAQRWLESLVAHLGVRIVWLDDYGQVGPMLRTMLGQRKAA